MSAVCLPVRSFTPHIEKGACMHVCKPAYPGRAPPHRAASCKKCSAGPRARLGRRPRRDLPFVGCRLRWRKRPSIDWPVTQSIKQSINQCSPPVASPARLLTCPVLVVEALGPERQPRQDVELRAWVGFGRRLTGVNQYQKMTMTVRSKTTSPCYFRCLPSSNKPPPRPEPQTA